MSLLDESIDAKTSIECARRAIENIYEKADRQNWQIQNDLRELLNQDPNGAYWYMVLIANDELRDELHVDLKPLPKDHESLVMQVKELNEIDKAKTRQINDEHNNFLILKNCIIRFMKHHPTFRLSDDERKLIFIN